MLLLECTTHHQSEPPQRPDTIFSLIENKFAVKKCRSEISEMPGDKKDKQGAVVELHLLNIIITHFYILS